MHTNSDRECQLVFLELFQDLLVARAASEVAVPLMHVAVAESALGSGVTFNRIFGKLLKCLRGVLLVSGTLAAVHVAGPVNTVNQDGLESERGVLEGAPVQSQRDKVLNSWEVVPHP